MTDLVACADRSGVEPTRPSWFVAAPGGGAVFVYRWNADFVPAVCRSSRFAARRRVTAREVPPRQGRHAAARRVCTIGSAEVAVTIGVEWTKCFTDVT
jgi:hypothetical protein